MNEDLKLICLGKIITPHGIRGAVKIKSYTQIPEDIEKYSPLLSKNGKNHYNTKIISCNNDIIIASVNGINNRNDADKLRNIELYTTRDKLPETDEEEFYNEDLIGLKALLPNGSEYGVIKAVLNYGASDIIEIKTTENKEEMFPFTKAIFPEINLKGGFVTINPPEVEFVREDDTN